MLPRIPALLTNLLSDNHEIFQYIFNNNHQMVQLLLETNGYGSFRFNNAHYRNLSLIEFATLCNKPEMVLLFYAYASAEEKSKIMTLCGETNQLAVMQTLFEHKYLTFEQLLQCLKSAAANHNHSAQTLNWLLNLGVGLAFHQLKHTTKKSLIDFACHQKKRNISELFKETLHLFYFNQSFFFINASNVKQLNNESLLTILQQCQNLTEKYHLSSPYITDCTQGIWFEIEQRMEAEFHTLSKNMYENSLTSENLGNSFDNLIVIADSIAPLNVEKANFYRYKIHCLLGWTYMNYADSENAFDSFRHASTYAQSNFLLKTNDALLGMLNATLVLSNTSSPSLTASRIVATLKTIKDITKIDEQNERIFKHVVANFLGYKKSLFDESLTLNNLLEKFQQYVVKDIYQHPPSHAEQKLLLSAYQLQNEYLEKTQSSDNSSLPYHRINPS